ncbi:MAG: S41 family peptidase [Fimbriimonas sp.]
MSAQSTTQSPATEPRLLRFPAIQGDTVAFTYAGDLWVSNVKGGTARRLTSHPGQEIRPKISPDGTLVAFTGAYDGSNNVYVVPIEGGSPKRLTFDSDAVNNTIGWTPDGKQIAYATAAGNFLYNQQRLIFVSPQGGIPKESPIKEITEASFSEDGNLVAYNRVNSYNYNWRRYRGGTQGRISLFDLAKGTYSELPSGREQSYFPMQVGKAIYYISDKNLGTQNLYRYDLGSKKDTQLTTFTDADIRFPNTDGKSIVFERDGYLSRYDIATGTTEKLSPKIISESLNVRPRWRNFGDAITAMTLSATGNRLVVEARGDLYSVPGKTGDTRNLTQTPGVRERFPEWSPDGKLLAYVSDATGEQEIYTQPQAGGAATQITTNNKIAPTGLTWSPDGKYIAITTRAYELWVLELATKKLTKAVAPEYGFGGFDWSPDSKWIAYTEGTASAISQAKLYEVATGKSTLISDGRFSDNNVAFDQNGKYLYVTSARTFAPTFGAFEFSLKVENAERVYVVPLTKDITNPLVAPSDEEPDTSAPAAPAPAPASPPKPEDKSIKVDFDGIGTRFIALPLPAGNYGGLIGTSNGVRVLSPGGNIQWVDLNSRTVIPIGTYPGLENVALNASRSKAAIQAAGQISIIDVRPAAGPGARVDTTGVAALWDARAEWKQMYWEAWRFVRDNYYDANLRGLDWNAIGKRYEAYLPYVTHRADLSYVLGLLIGELGTGHSYVQGGEIGVAPSGPPVAKLGADYVVDGDRIKFSKVFVGSQFDESRRGPLGEPGLNVKAGDYLLEIDGQAVTSKTNPDELLFGKAGRYVTLTVNTKPSLEGSRKIRVRPVVSEAQVRYAEFIESTRKKVLELSGGRIGYMHISNTSQQGAIDFIQGFWSQSGLDALIVDERWNGGGFIQPWFANVLARKPMASIQNRHAADQFESPIHDGPKVMLINQYAGSGGDFFPYMFRKNKLGPLIGKRTWGGLVGISGGAPLVDGGSVTAPEFAIFDPETNEIVAENTGIDPDIDVDMRPDLVAQGKDPQIEAAVAHLLEQLKKNPPKPKRTTLPKVAKPGRVGG